MNKNYKTLELDLILDKLAGECCQGFGKGIETEQ